jgi:hypothetical protein
MLKDVCGKAKGSKKFTKTSREIVGEACALIFIKRLNIGKSQSMEESFG